MENLIVSINCVIPIFLNLLVGYYAKARKLLPENVFPQLNLMSFNALIPLMVFDNVYSADYSKPIDLALTAFVLIGIVILYILTRLILHFTEKDPRRRGAYIQNAFRSNVGILGIALAPLLIDSTGMAAVTIIIAILIPFFNVLAVITLETCRGGKVDLRVTLQKIAKNPLILATLIGILFVLTGLRLPKSVASSISSLGKTGTQLAILSLGASLNFSGLRKNVRPLFFGCLTRLVIIPFAAISAALFMGLRGNAMATVLLCFAMPTATTAYSMAQAYDSDYELTGQLVVVSSVISCATLFVWIFLLKQFGLM